MSSVGYIKSALCIFAWSFLLVLGLLLPVSAQTPGLMEKAFFLNDIYNFVGKPYKSPSFDKTQTISQSFKAKYANLNRIVLPFYVREKIKKGDLTFDLYEIGQENKPVYSTHIHFAEFTPPAPIGTHEVKGVLYYIWIPPQANSKNKTYVWKIKKQQKDTPMRVGLYLTDHSDPQLQPVKINGQVWENAYVAFYSYCQYRFNWSDISTTTWERFKQEKLFLFFFLLLCCGLGVYIKKSG